MATVVVTGGTGTLGREVVTRLVARHHHPRLFCHQVPASVPENVEVVKGDLISGRGLREAVAGVDAIIHCASNPQNADQVDIEGTRSLLQIAQASQAHLIYPSIVGVKHSTYAYYKAKHATEEIIEQGPLPWTIMRITQFHDLVLKIMQLFGVDSQPVVAVAGGMRFQSIDAGEVADHLILLMEQGPAGHVPDMGGPQICTFEEMTEVYLRVRNRKAVIQSKALVGDLFDAFRSGINLIPDHTEGTITWEAFLHHLYDH